MLFNHLGARVLALTLLVLGGGADHHYPAVATDHPAFLTHFLDRGTHLHWVWLSIFQRQYYHVGQLKTASILDVIASMLPWASTVSSNP